jgi:hypothetical protein
MRGAQRRGAVEQGRDRLPGQLLVGKAVGFGGDAKALQRLQRQAHQLAGEAVGGVALVGVDVDAREALALEHIADHGTIPVEGRAGAVDRGRALGVPAVPLVPHALDTNRMADRLRQQCRVDPGVAGVVAPVGARARDPDPVHLVRRQSQRAGDPVAREMRLLRAGPQGGAVGPRRRRRRPGPCWHATERPLVFGLDDPRR